MTNNYKGAERVKLAELASVPLIDTLILAQKSLNETKESLRVASYKARDSETAIRLLKEQVTALRLRLKELEQKNSK